MLLRCKMHAQVTSCLLTNYSSTSWVYFQEVVKLFSDIRLAFGESDEYSFVLHKGTTLYGESVWLYNCQHTSPTIALHLRETQCQADISGCVSLHGIVCAVLECLLPTPAPQKPANL